MINRSFRGPSASRALRVLCLLTLATLAVGCSSKAKRDNTMLNPDNPFRASVDNGSAAVPQSEALLKQEASRAYLKAHAALLNTDYETAVTQYQLLIARYPFTEYATQAELEKVFAQYRSFKPDEALLAADRFLREHPRHKHADYIQYLKGLINSARTESLSDYLPIDNSQKDVNAERRAYDDFAVLVQRYPQSVYAGDARKRMIHLRNRIASHELSIVRYYVKRQAWVAVAKRAENLIAEYPGAPATADALVLLREAYDKLDLKPQQVDLERIIASNQESIRMAAVPAADPGPRSRIGFPDEAPAGGTKKLSAPALAGAKDAAAPASDTTVAAKEAPKGFFAKLASYLDVLNGSYSLDKDKVKDSAAPQPAGGETRPASDSTRPSTRNPDRQPSLTTGPYFQETVVDVPPVFSDGSAPKAAEPAAAAAADAGTATTAPATAATPAPAAAEPARKKRGFFGWLDSLSGSYTVDKDGKVVETPPADDTSAKPADAPAATTPAN